MILHLIPESVLSNPSRGACKDVQFRIQWLKKESRDYVQVPVAADDPEKMEQLIREHQPDHILFEYTHYSRMVRHVQKHHSKIQIAVRSHNIEPLQHLDNHGWFPSRGPVWMLYGMIRLLAMDIQIKRSADVILSINEWENRVYWNRLPGRARVEWLPYIPPENLLPQNPESFENRKVIACLPTSQENRKSRDLVFRFQQFAQQMKQRGCDYEFAVTGDLNRWDLPDCPEVTRTGFVDDLAEFMGRCRAVCMLSPLGYGFKTTLADALAAGAHVIAHPALIHRSPRRLQPFMMKSTESADVLLASLQDGPAAEALRIDLIQLAEKVMNRHLRGDS